MAAAGIYCISIPPPRAAGVRLTTGEITVGFTDYLLAVECAFFALMLIRTDDTWLEIRWFFVTFFGFTALASLTGGTYHLLLSNSSSMSAAILWKTTVIAIGAATFAAWSIGACQLFAQPIRGHIVKTAFTVFVIYSIYVVAVDDHFWVAIANYIPATVFLGLSFAYSYRRHPDPTTLSGLLGISVTGVAAAMQRLSLSLHPLYFNHNATYHLPQEAGLFLIFRAAIYFVRNPYQAASVRCNN
ncbi:MAG: DUF6962 family protein [Methylotenera sp.]